MNELKIFKNNDFGEIRVTTVEGNAYFNLNDLCKILDINNSRQAKTRL